jgi:hypothetical protein
MESINTEFVMTVEGYNLLSNIVELADITKVLSEISTNDNIKEQPIASIEEFSRLITDISTGKIKHNTSDNNKNEIQTLENRMQTITLDEIKDWYKKEQEKTITPNEAEVFDYYKNTYLVELNQKQAKQEQLSEKEKEILDYEKSRTNVNVNKYNIPGITDKLAEKGLIIADIRVEKEAPNGAKVIGLRDVNGLINGGAGVFAADGCINIGKRILKPVDRISNGGIGRIVCSGEHPLLDIREGFLKAENNFIVFDIRPIIKK